MKKMMLWTKHISTKSSYQRCQNPSSIVGFKTFVTIESCEKSYYQNRTSSDGIGIGYLGLWNSGYFGY